jgi:hypothetical protein
MRNRKALSPEFQLLQKGQELAIYFLLMIALLAMDDWLLMVDLWCYFDRNPNLVWDL